MTPAKTKITKRDIGLALLVTGALLAAGCGGKKGEQSHSAAAPAVVKGVQLETVKTARLPETIELSGTVRARTSAMVAARIPGSVTLLGVREGDRVRKGQLLARLEAGENLAQAAAAASGVDEARRALEEAQARKKLADKTMERFTKLFNEQAVSRQEYDVRQTERELALQGVARAEARLRQAQESSKGAGAVADYTRITAPISGIISAKQVDLGATVFPGQPLMTIEDEGSYQLELAVPENMATRVKLGQSLQVSLDALGQAISAKVSEVVPAADPVSRTFMARVNLNQKGLRSGMFGRGSIPVGIEKNSLLIQRQSLVERGAMTSVWVVANDGLARMRLVKTGRNVGDRVEVLSGLSDGERVVVGGVDKVIEGAKVE